MTRAKFRITLPEQAWVSSVSRNYSEAVIEVLAAVPGDTTGYALIRVSSAAVDEFVTDMENHDTVLAADILHRTSDEVTVQFETARPVLLAIAQKSGIPIEWPVVIQNGEATVSMTGSRDKLSAFAERLDANDVSFSIEYIRAGAFGDDLLSDRQLAIVRMALDHGYYDTPRQCTLTELAEDVGIAKSTCSDLLHRAEEVIIKEFMRDIPDRRVDEYEAEFS